ncbi:MAG: hypothetical protein K8T91_03495, partial [Planctomycetes bacterium]|nr:hypothetical protein [Planctomycetota bacterium]
MRHANSHELSFKFRYLSNGQPAGFTAWRGVATPQALTLGDDTITYDRIVDRAVVDDRLILGIASPETLSA